MRTASIKEPASMLFFLTAAFFLLILSLSPVAVAAQADRITVSADPGTLIRWSAPATRRCSMASRSWPALQETCYYPVDLLHKPGLIKIKRWGYKSSESAYISVEPFSYGTREITLGDIPQANPSPKDLMRSQRERKMLNKIWKRREGPAKFTLPLGTPARPLPEGKDFGKMQIFNGKPAIQPHMGADYPVPVDSPVFSVAEGTVVLAKDLFFPGNAVFIDHGDGLISMYFTYQILKLRRVKKSRRAAP